MAGHDVVISGIGAQFPKSLNLDDFGKDLLANKYLCEATDRWELDPALGIKPLVGYVNHTYFDDLFYGINKKLAKNMDPVAKNGYLRAFEAILDAGLHPAELRGADVSVNAGVGINEFEQCVTLSKQLASVEGYSIMGMSRSMFPNRISFFFDFKGPSVTMDSSWVTGHAQIEQAAEFIRDGRSEAVVVVSGNLCRYPATGYLLKTMGLISEDGLTRSFDENASGSIRSDSSVAFLLQRADQAKRCYAKVLAAGAGSVGAGSRIDMTLPSPRGMNTFLTDLYRNYSIDPKRIAYLEADGGGHVLREECELNAIDDALVQGAGRKAPLLVGSVKSNVGLTDSASGLVAICKAVVAMETGTIPATINFNTPNSRCKALKEGRMRVVNTNLPLELSEDSVVAVNTLGISSTVGHTILQPNPRPPQQPQNPADHLPRLITLSGRTEDSLNDMIAKLNKTPFDTNFYRLAQDAFSTDIRGYDYRSYAIFPPAGDEVPQIQRVEKRMCWFVYSGMGSQWEGMGAGLMAVPIFAETIERLHALLEPKGLDLKAIITETGATAFDSIMKSFVGITACQVALTNVMWALDIRPDGIIGHSVGELGCAYADGCLTEEQTVMAAWARGHASTQAKLTKGMMAAVGLGYREVLPLLPPTIDVACHNSNSSCTLSGPAEDVEKFVKRLTDDGVFARAVNASNIAYHSRYIQPAAPFLRAELEKVIPNPKKRSSKWVSTSVPIDCQDRELGKYCSAEYQTNNLLSSVLFEEGLQCIPSNGMLIEIAPHGLMQAILKRALPEALHIPLCQRGNTHPVHTLLTAIGRTSFGAASPKVAALYPDIEFPVPRGTPSLARLATWQIDDSTFNDSFQYAWEKSLPSTTLNNDTPSLRVNGTRVCPLSEILTLIWRIAAKLKSFSLAVRPVTFVDFYVDSWKPIPTEGSLDLTGSFLPETTLVEVLDISGQQLKVLAHCSFPDLDNQCVQAPQPPTLDMEDTITVTKEELYRDMETRGLRFCSRFHNINAIQMGKRDWIIHVWHDEDLSKLLESVVQVYILMAMEASSELCLPRTFKRIDLDPSKIGGNKELSLHLNLASGVLSGVGLYVTGVTTSGCPAELRFGSDCPAALQFIRFGETKYQNVEDFLRLTVHTVLEPKLQKSRFNLMEVPNGTKTTTLSKALVNAIRAATGVEARIVPLEGANAPGSKMGVPLLVSGSSTLKQAVDSLVKGVANALLVWSEDRLGGAKGVKELVVLAEQKLDGDWLTLLRRADTMTNAVVVEKKTGTKLPLAIPTGTSKVVLVWRGLSEEEVEAAVQEVDAMPYSSRARLVFILDSTAPPFSLTDPLYADQLARGVRVNVLVNVLVEGRTWGSWKTLTLPKPFCSALSASRLDGMNLEFLATNPLEENRLFGHVDFVGQEAGKGASIMGIARWMGDHLRPKLDPLLRWAVPAGWAAADAVTVPYVYSVAYLLLKVHASAKKGESILINDATSAMGQAAVRVAAQLGCSPIYTTVRDENEMELLAKIFPQLERRNILTCGDGGSFETRLRCLTHSRGVRLVFNTLSGKEMNASLRCVGSFGRMVHYNREDMLAGRNIGLNMFLRSASVFGFSGNELFCSTDLIRSKVADAVTQGLSDGTVKPIVGIKIHNALEGVSALADCKKAVIEMSRNAPSVDQQCDPQKCYVVAGRQATDALLVASKLSLLGAKHILLAVGSSPSAASIRQRQRVLRTQQGTHLQVKQVCDWSAAAAEALVRAAAGMAPIHTSVVVVKDEGDLIVPTLLSSALPKHASLVLFAESTPTVRQLAGIAQQTSSNGRRTACMAGPLSVAVDYLVELVSETSSAPLVTVLPAAVTAANDQDADPGTALPRTKRDLARLGRDSARCADRPSVKEIASLGLRIDTSKYPHEFQPLFVLPPCGVLEPTFQGQLAALAAMLYIPVVVVETTARGSLKDTAKTVVETILKRQPCGPYNLLGWTLSTVVALEVQRQMDVMGKRGVLFLGLGDVHTVRDWAKAYPAHRRITEVVGELNGDSATRRGAQIVAGVIEAIAQHESDVKRPFAGPVHVLRNTVDAQKSLHENDPQVYLKTISTTRLDNPAVAVYINENNALMELASIEDKRSSIDYQCL